MKHLVIPCAVFLGMGMAPNPDSDPLKRPDVARARAAANECQDNARSDRRLAACLRTPASNLERALDQYLAEMKAGLPTEEKARLDAARDGWSAERARGENSRRGRRRSADATITLLHQRFVTTLGRFTWVAKKVAAIRPAQAPVDAAPVSAPAVAAPVQAEVLAALAPAPSPAPPPVPAAPITLPVAPVTYPSTVFKPAIGERMYLAMVQFVFHGCMWNAGSNVKLDLGRAACETQMKEQMTVAYDGYLKARLANVAAEDQTNLQADQRRWETIRRKKCDITVTPITPAFERAAARCWYKETVARFGWADAIGPRPSQ